MAKYQTIDTVDYVKYLSENSNSDECLIYAILET